MASFFTTARKFFRKEPAAVDAPGDAAPAVTSPVAVLNAEAMTDEDRRNISPQVPRHASPGRLGAEIHCFAHGCSQTRRRSITHVNESVNSLLREFKDATIEEGAVIEEALIQEVRDTSL